MSYVRWEVVPSTRRRDGERHMGHGALSLTHDKIHESQISVRTSIDWYCPVFTFTYCLFKYDGIMYVQSINQSLLPYISSCSQLSINRFSVAVPVGQWLMGLWVIGHRCNGHMGHRSRKTTHCQL